MEKGTSKILYLSDLDGTLLTPEENISDFTAEVLHRLTEEGMLFSYATARSFATAAKVTTALGKLEQPVIVYNGEAIVNAADGSVLDAAYFTPEEIGLIRETLEAAGISPLVYSRDGNHTDDEHVTYVPGKISRGMAYYLESRKGDKRLRTAMREALYGENTFYVTAIEDSRQVFEAAYEKLSADTRFTVLLQRDLYSDCYYFEIMPRSAMKANAAERLAALYGCTGIVCFGDGDNDRSMFRIASACYAVGNASATLKAEATAVIGSNKEDGVARKLLELWTQENE